MCVCPAIAQLHTQRLLGFQAVSRLRAAARKLKLSADSLFNELDRSGCGQLHVKEIKSLFELIGVNLSQEALLAVRFAMNACVRACVRVVCVVCGGSCV